MPDRLELHVLSASPPSGVAESQAQPTHAAAIPAGRPTETIDLEGLRANESSLAPVDRGLGAWSFLLSAFVVEALVWGFPNAYGVFLLKYLEDPAWAHQKHASLLLPLVGPMASGFQYSAAPITFSLATRYPRHRRKGIWIGTLISFVSLFAASYAKDVRALVVLQGTLYGLGGALLHAAAIYYMSEWFVERRGLANGVIGAGSAAGGLVLPLALPPVIESYGTDKTIRFYAIVNICILIATVPFLRSRLPESRVAHAPIQPRATTSNRASYLKDRTFWLINLANTVQSLAYFVPMLWLPTYASSIRLSSRGVSLSLAMLNASGLIGRLALGVLSDVMDPWFLACSTLSLCAFSVFVLWGTLSYTLAGLLSFAVMYGCLAGGWTNLWSRFIRPIAKDDPSMATSIYGGMMLFRGIGNILSTPISTALLSNVDPNTPDLSLGPKGLVLGGAFKGQYEKVIVYAGTCFAAAAAVVVVGWIVNRRLAPQNSLARA